MVADPMDLDEIIGSNAQDEISRGSGGICIDEDPDGVPFYSFL